MIELKNNNTYYKKRQTLMKQKVLERLRISKKIEQMLKEPKNTMLILLIDDNWDVSGLNDFAKKICGNEINQQQIQCSSEFKIFRFQSKDQQNQVICLDISWMRNTSDCISKDQNCVYKFVSSSYYLNLLNGKLNEISENSNKKISIYLALQLKNKIEKTKELLGQFQKILGSYEYGTIYCNAKKALTAGINQIYLDDDNNPKNEQQIIALQNILKNNTITNQIFNFDYLSGSEKAALSSVLQKFKLQTEHIIISALKPVEKIMDSIFKNETYEFGGIFQEHRIQLDFISQLSLQQMNSEINDSTVEQMETFDEKLIYLIFAAEFISIFQNFLSKSKQSQKVGAQFFEKVIEAMKMLPKTQRQESKKTKILIKTLFNQIQKITALSHSEKRQYLITDIISICKKFIPTKSQFICAILCLQIQKNADLKYYDSLGKLIPPEISINDFKTQAQFQLIGFLKLKYEMLLKITKSEKYLSFYVGKNDKKVAKAIKDLLFVCKNNKIVKEEQKKIKFSQLQQRHLLKILQNTKHVFSINIHSVMKNAANYLNYINRRQLALEIYKKMKFVYQIEQCLKYIVSELSDEQKSQIYVSISQYFDQIGQNQLSRKYLQLAYENNYKQLPELVAQKQKDLKGQKRQYEKQLNILKDFKSQAPESYYNSNLSNQFWNEIQNLEESTLSQNIHDEFQVKINKKQATKIFNFFNKSKIR